MKIDLEQRILELEGQLAVVTAERDEWASAAKKVVLERLSKIQHARESMAMCRLHRLVVDQSSESTEFTSRLDEKRDPNAD